MASTVGLFMLVIGIVLAFAGWRLYEFTILLFGAVMGLGAGFLAGVYLADPAAFPQAGPGLPGILGGIGGAGGFFVAYVAHRLVYGLTGFAVGALLGFALVENVVVAVLLGLGGGYVTWMIHKLSVIVLTALVGGGFVSLAFGGSVSGETQVLVAGVVAVAGMAVQVGVFGTHAGYDEQAEGEMGLTCPRCGHPCKPGDAYCYECGADLRWCGSCGRAGLSEWAYCDRCGDAFESG